MNKVLTNMYQDLSALEKQIARGNIGAEDSSNKVTSISSSSTDAQYPSAKCVFDAVENSIGKVKDGGSLTSGSAVTVPNNSVSTLSSSQASLTLNVELAAGEVPNFAVEITAGATIVLTVTKTIGGVATTLKYAEAAGNTLESGKFYQITCVGNCWTLAEFTAPS